MRPVPHLYPVLDSLLHGETVGEAYQRLIDGLLEWTQLNPDELVLAKIDPDNTPAVMRRSARCSVSSVTRRLRPLEPLDNGQSEPVEGTGRAARIGLTDGREPERFTHMREPVRRPPLCKGVVRGELHRAPAPPALQRGLEGVPLPCATPGKTELTHREKGKLLVRPRWTTAIVPGLVR